MEKLLKLLVESIVEKPKKVKITQQTLAGQDQADSGFVNFQLQVDPEDLKIVIGKKGRTIRALRNLLRLRAIKEGVRANLEIQEQPA